MSHEFKKKASSLLAAANFARLKSRAVAEQEESNVDAEATDKELQIEESNVPSKVNPPTPVPEFEIIFLLSLAFNSFGDNSD